MFMKMYIIERRLYYKGDYTLYRYERHKSVQETWDIVVKHMIYAINRYIPITTKPIICNTKSFIDHNVKSHKKSRRKSCIKYYRKPIENNWKAYTIERNTKSDHARVRFESNICRDSKQNPKTCWQYVNLKHKKVNKSMCSNYRLVSLTSIVCTLLEPLIRDGVLSFLETHNKIAPFQHGLGQDTHVLLNY